MGLYVRHPASFGHDTGGHPESARRITAIEAALADAGWAGLERVEAPRASREEIARVHTEALIDSVADLAAAGGGMIDMDTVASAGSWEAAQRSAGGAVEAVNLLLAPDPAHEFAFCALRPPGHHAERARSMGFCLFNNVAIAAAHALDAHGVERVLVIDWDVHHGNGTEEIFWDSGSVLYSSIHQSPLYPGTGAAGDVGAGAGAGYTVNMPVAPGSGGAVFGALVEHCVVPLIKSWRPGLVCISAGYDAHHADPLAECELETTDYGEMASAIALAARAAGAPVLVCLEGGYDVGALAESALATVRALADPVAPAPLDPAPAAPHVARLAASFPGFAA